MIKINSPDFNISQISDSGQCFRMFDEGDNRWRIFSMNNMLEIQKISEHEYIFECSEEEYEKIWFEYFDMRTDYSAIKTHIRTFEDPFLNSAIDYGYGIRILKQDLWETIVTFIISQQNNIPRIKKIIFALCEANNSKFPTPEDLKNYTEKDFENLGFGYRAEYMTKIVTETLSGRLDLKKLKTFNYEESIKFLKTFRGIGEKVANCIALYGLHHLPAFPVDVWIKRTINTRYDGNFALQKSSPFAGIIQQYMFFYERNLKKNIIHHNSGTILG